MLPNAFIDKPRKPTDKDLAAALGSAKALWDQLLAELADDVHLVDREWNSYSPKAGWSLRVKEKKRNILYLGPCQGSFRVALVLGGKAVQAALHSKLPPRMIKMIQEAKQYPEGRAVRMDVKRASDINIIKILARVKLDN